MSLTELLSSGVLGGLVGIGGLVVGAIGVWLAIRHKPTKRISYAFTRREELFSNKFASASNFDLRLNGKPVRDLFSVQLVIKNPGNQLILSQDLREPLTIRFDRRVNLFPISVHRKRGDIPVTVAASLAPDGNSQLTITTDLIEPTDEIVCDVLYENDAHALFDLSGRLIGGDIIPEPPRVAYDDYHIRIRQSYVVTPVLLAVFSTATVTLIMRAFVGIFAPTFDLDAHGLLYGLFVSAVLLTSVLAIKPYFARRIQREIAEYEAQLEERRKLLDRAPTRGP